MLVKRKQCFAFLKKYLFFFNFQNWCNKITHLSWELEQFFFETFFNDEIISVLQRKYTQHHHFKTLIINLLLSLEIEIKTQKDWGWNISLMITRIHLCIVEWKFGGNWQQSTVQIYSNEQISTSSQWTQNGVGSNTL